MPSQSFHTHSQLLNKKSSTTTVVAYQFETHQRKEKENFLRIIEQYKSKLRTDTAYDHFIKTALKYMEDFGVHKDLEAYKKLIDVLPKGRYITRNKFQVMFDHYPAPQQLIMDLLSQMEHFKVIPDREVEQMLLLIFGKYTHPIKKYWRMMYWMPKFKYANPWQITDLALRDPKELAKLTMQKITHIDPRTIITTFQTKELSDSTEDTWIVSAMSPLQEDLLSVLPTTETLFIEGPFQVYYDTQMVDYFVLRGYPIEREIIDVDPDDISNIEIPYHNLRKRGVPPTSFEQNDATYYASCVTGTSTKESVVSWMRFLQQKNPKLKDIPVVFKIRTPPGDALKLKEPETSLEIKKTSRETSPNSEQ